MLDANTKNLIIEHLRPFQIETENYGAMYTYAKLIEIVEECLEIKGLEYAEKDVEIFLKGICTLGYKNYFEYTEPVLKINI